MYENIEPGMLLETYLGNFSRNAQLVSIASSLMLSRTGIVFSDGDISKLINGLADLRERWQVSPDQVMDALAVNEPELAQEW